MILRHGHLENADLSGAPETSLACGVVSTLILEGTFRNSLSGLSQKVIVIGQRRSSSQYIDVCVGSGCESILSGMKGAADRLVARGQREAASTPQVVSGLLVEVMAAYKEPCIGKDESGHAYLERAEAHCRDYVKGKLSFAPSIVQEASAGSACAARAAERNLIATTRPTDQTCKQ